MKHFQPIQACTHLLVILSGILSVFMGEEGKKYFKIHMNNFKSLVYYRWYNYITQSSKVLGGNATRNKRRQVCINKTNTEQNNKKYWSTYVNIYF